MDYDDLFDPRIEEWRSAETCVREVAHHPRKGGSSNILGELSASLFRLRFTSMQSKTETSSIYNQGFLRPFDIPISSIYRITLVNRKKRHKKEISSGDLLRSSSEEFEYSSMIICCADFSIYKFSTVTEETNFPTEFLDYVLNFGVRRHPLSQFGIILGVKKLNNLELVHEHRTADDAWLTEFTLEPLLRQQPLPIDHKTGSVEVLPSLEFDPDHFSDRRLPRISCKLSSESPSILIRCGKIAKGKRNAIEHELRTTCRHNGFLKSDSEPHVRIVKLKAHGLPRPEEVQAARKRLRDLVLGYDPDGSTTTWLDQLDATQWMTLVSRTLKVAGDIAAELQRDLGCALMVSEGSDKDWNCVICSLVNVLLFPRLRCVEGLREVLVREWCAAQHPFSSCLEVAGEGAGGPLFPLFLDCLQQLWSQFPHRFAFGPELLIALHDLGHAGLFREFLVHVDRRSAALAPSIFDLGPLLSPDGARLLENPVFGLAVEMQPDVSAADLVAKLEAVGVGDGAALEPDWEVRCLRFWRENYLRPLTFMDIGQAGRAAELWRYRELLHLARANRDGNGNGVQLRIEKPFHLASGADFHGVTAFFPFSKEREQPGLAAARASCYPGRGISHFDMYGDVS